MLNRGIRRWDLVLLTINSIIGAGIFGLPAKVFALTGPFSLLSFLACAMTMLVFIFCFAEVSSRFEQTGGPYTYVRAAFGPIPGFLTGWLLMLSRVFIYATLINLQVTYLGYFSGAFETPMARWIMIGSITIFLTWINYRGIRNMNRLNSLLTIAKLVPLAIFIGAGLFHVRGTHFQPTAVPDAKSFSQSVLLLIFAFGGFESVLVNTGEVHNPRKTLPFALVAATLVVACFYILIQVVSIGTLPDLAHSSKPLADAASVFMGKGGAAMISGGAFISILATLNVLMLSGSRLPYALSLENQLPSFFSGIHPRYQTPTASLLVTAGLTMIVSLAWGFLSALTISVIIRITVYLLVCGSLLRLRQKEKTNKDYYRVAAGPLLALTGIGVCLWLYTAAGWMEIRSALIFLGIGLLVYALHRRFKPTGI
jgi:basic amino acid/polyamine antiporter, APA family